MTALKLQDVDLSPEPDLRPIYPTAASISPLLSSDSGLAPSQRSQLVLHCLTRACFFGDLATLTFLLTDTHSQAHVDLAYQDEDGLGLPGITIHGLGSDSDREVEREECVRLLVSQGVDVNHVDNGMSLAVSRYLHINLTTTFLSGLDCAAPCRPTSAPDASLLSAHARMFSLRANFAWSHSVGHHHRSRDYSWARRRRPSFRGSYAQ